MRSILILFSYHHRNTRRVASVLAEVLDARIREPPQIDLGEVQEYDLVGFGSGIYSGKHHETLLKIVNDLPQEVNKKAFIFSTCGPPEIGFTDKVVAENHSKLRGELHSKGYQIVDEFSCLGWNTNGFLKFFGGLNRGRPNDDDLKRAEEFARKLKRSYHFP